MTPTLETLRRDAEAATPGPWLECTQNPKNKHQAGHIISFDSHSIAIPCVVLRYDGMTIEEDIESAKREGDANSAHIANFNPQTALALLDCVEAMRDSIALADDYGDSGISKPIREALENLRRVLGERS